MGPELSSWTEAWQPVSPVSYMIRQSESSGRPTVLSMDSTSAEFQSTSTISPMGATTSIIPSLTFLLPVATICATGAGWPLNVTDRKASILYALFSESPSQIGEDESNEYFANQNLKAFWKNSLEPMG